MTFLNKDYNEIIEQAKILEEIRRFKHDYKNKIFGLKALLEAGEYDRAKEYLNMVEDEFSAISLQLNTTSFSDNVIVDAVLQNLAAKCKKNNIDISFSAIVADALNIFSDTDICILFSNLTDNAFEAANKCTGIQKHVSVYFARREKWNVITVGNSFDGTLNKSEDGELLTTKTNTESHGFGIKSVKKIIEKVPGAIYKTEHLPDDKLFKTHIFLPK